MVDNSTNREKLNKANIMYFLMEVHTKTCEIFLPKNPKLDLPSYVQKYRV